MDAIKVKHCDIDRVSFDSKPLVILDDSEALGDDRLLKVITAEIKDAIVDIPPPPDNSSFRRMLARYYMQTYSSDKYEIAYVVQVHKFSKTSSITWDPEGQKRLVAHATLHDIVVELSNVECVFVKEGSMYAINLVRSRYV
ncbi:MAG: hypothetical protein M1840_004149 [Geoglossum simile]|nr:MAG: hypothetical protein M1840_004149 [Geoglossum simile]